MLKHRSAAGVAFLDGEIYACGGHDGLSIFDSVRILTSRLYNFYFQQNLYSQQKRCALLFVLKIHLYISAVKEEVCFTIYNLLDLNCSYSIPYKNMYCYLEFFSLPVHRLRSIARLQTPGVM